VAWRADRATVANDIDERRELVLAHRHASAQLLVQAIEHELDGALRTSQVRRHRALLYVPA
jgi:hypothetical protein